MTWLEWLLVIAIITVFAAMIFAARTRQRATGRPIWEGDNNDKYPMSVPRVKSASVEFTNSPNSVLHQQIMSNQPGPPEVVNYSQETEKARSVASNSAFLCNSNISYFVGQDDVPFADGSVKQESTAGLRNTITNATTLAHQQELPGSGR